MFCLNCMREIKEYKKVTVPVTFYARGREITYDETRALCPDCDWEIYVSDIEDLNVQKRNIAYWNAVKGE